MSAKAPAGAQRELWATRLLHQYEELLPYAEEIVRLALNPLWRPPEPHTREEAELIVEHNNLMRAVLRTGGLFLFDRRDIPHMELEPITELPPLPFPRMWIEVDGLMPQECLFRDTDGRMSFWLGFGILEQEPGVSWRVIMPLLDQDTIRAAVEGERERNPAAVHDLFDALCLEDYWIKLQPHGNIGCSLTRDGGHDRFVAGVADRQDMDLQRVGWTPELLVQLINTLGVKLEPRRFQRPAAREFARRRGYDHPQVYRVKLGAVTDQEDGFDDRGFRHRWLVRGHYRKNESGRYFTPHKGRCSWVRPYVKGPDGAPWKGRPLYVTPTAGEPA